MCLLLIHTFTKSSIQRHILPNSDLCKNLEQNHFLLQDTIIWTDLIPVINHHNLAVCAIICSLMTSWKTPKYLFLHPITRKKGLCSDMIFYSCKKIFDLPLPIWISLEYIQISSSSMAHETGQWTFQKEQSTKERRYFVVPCPPRSPLPSESQFDFLST